MQSHEYNAVVLNECEPCSPINSTNPIQTKEMRDSSILARFVLISDSADWLRTSILVLKTHRHDREYLLPERGVLAECKR